MLKQYRFVANAPRGPMGWWVLLPIALVSLATLSWTVTGTDTEIGKLVQGLPWIADFIGACCLPI